MSKLPALEPCLRHTFSSGTLQRRDIELAMVRDQCGPARVQRQPGHSGETDSPSLTFMTEFWQAD